MEKSYSLDSKEVVDKLKSDDNKGLTGEEASKRLVLNGPNSLGEEKRAPLWKRFLSQFADAMVVILILAALLSAFMAYRNDEGIEGWIDVFVILAIVVLNAVLGVYQEGKADQALLALKKMSSPQTKVLRDGEAKLVDSEEIVEGDIVLIEAGDAISADIRLLDSNSLKAEESSLTGESVAVDKDAFDVLAEDCPLAEQSNMLFMGTSVTYGRATGIVVGTGKNTGLGRIADRLSGIKDEDTPLQKDLNHLGKILAAVCILVCIVVFIVDLTVQHIAVTDALMTAVSLAVAAIPEGLAAVVTIVLSIGMTKMAQNKAIVKRLLAVETLGSVDVICSDKTGTLTRNSMTVQVLFDGDEVYAVEGSGYDPEGRILDGKGNPVKPGGRLKELIRAAVLCNDADITKDDDGKYICIGDPTEGALTVLGMKTGLLRSEAKKKYERLRELPFDSDRKMMTTYHTGIEDDRLVSLTKGAPDIILRRCAFFESDSGPVSMTSERSEKIMEQNRKFASKAIRVLAFAYRTHDKNAKADLAHEDNMVFLGLVGMIDPERKEAKDAIAVCRNAGIRTVMITGDYKDSAVAIASNLNMTDGAVNALSGEELDKMTDDELKDRCEDISVYARVSPEHKVRIVSALKANGHIASMTGDGVNDAMALKSADIGVAMGITGTDVAKNSADMILMDDNFATIVKAVEQGRIIYSNIRKFVSFLLSCNIGEILVIFLLSLIPDSVIPGIAAPLTAIQLLWLNLITDSFPALALGREKGEPGIMNLPPRPSGEPIINGYMLKHIVIQACSIFISVAAAFLLSLTSNRGFFFDLGTDPLKGSRTVAFATLILAELFRAYASRSERISVFKLGFFSNRLMNVSVGLSLALLFAVIYIPGVNRVFDNVALNISAWLVIIPLAVIPFAANEISKAIKASCNLRR